MSNSLWEDGRVLETHQAQSRKLKAEIMKSRILFCALLLLLTGCAGPNSFSKVLKEAGTANKHIKAEFSGWNAHMSYESWPAGGSTNTSVIINQ